MTLLLEKQVGRGETQVSFGSGETPKYQALEEAINGYFSDMLGPLNDLQQKLFDLLPIPQVKQEDETFRYLARHRRVVDEAIDLYLEQMAGPDLSRQGFVQGGPESDTPDGVIQQRSFVTYVVGVNRAAEVMGTANTIAVSRRSPAVEAMLNRAFTRLTAKGEFALAGIRDDVHSILVSATDAGLSPLDTARQLATLFNPKERQYFELVARTEAAYAAIEGSRDQYREFGVTLVKWLLSSSACPICQAYEGLLISIDDTERHPPEGSHPQCVCDLVPAGFEEG